MERNGIDCRTDGLSGSLNPLMLHSQMQKIAETQTDTPLLVTSSAGPMIGGIIQPTLRLPARRSAYSRQSSAYEDTAATLVHMHKPPFQPSTPFYQKAPFLIAN